MSEYDPTEVKIENIGTVDELSFKLEAGTVTVLRGPNGVGKSTTIDAVAKAQTGNKNIRLSSKDGTIGGQVDFGGVRIKIGRSGQNKMAGEPVIESVEGDMSIGDFVDPKMKSDSAADAKRIKALAVLTGQEADESLFYSLLEDRETFLATVPEDARTSDDLLDMSNKIKRAIEVSARAKEDAAKNCSSEMQALKDVIEGVDLKTESDEEGLEHAVDEAKFLYQKLVSDREWFDENRERYAKAKEVTSEDLPDTESLEIELSADKVKLEKLEAKVAELKSSISKQEDYIEAVESRMAEREALVSLVSEFDDRFEPDDELIADAKKMVTEAIEARNMGVQVRSAKEKQAKVAEYAKKKKSLENEAETLRSAAKGTEDVLADVIKKSCNQLKVDKDFRLVVEHPKRGECYFSELSEGERWKLGIEIAIEAFKKKGGNGLLAIPQECWESLDYNNRKIIIEAVAGTDMRIITAEVTREASDSPTIEAQVAEA